LIDDNLLILLAGCASQKHTEPAEALTGYGVARSASDILNYRIRSMHGCEHGTRFRPQPDELPNGAMFESDAPLIEPLHP